MIFASTVASIFPYDPRIDSAMGYHHLLIAYYLTWFVHICYLGYVGRKWYLAKSKKT